MKKEVIIIKEVLDELNRYKSSYYDRGILIHVLRSNNISKKQMEDGLKKLERDFTFINMKYSSKDEKRAFKEVGGNEIFKWFFDLVSENDSPSLIMKMIQNKYRVPVYSLRYFRYSIV